MINPKQPAQTDTLESLLASLEQAVEESKEKSAAIAHIRESLTGYSEQIQEAKAKADSIMGNRNTSAPIPHDAVVFDMQKIKDFVIGYILPVAVMIVITWFVLSLLEKSKEDSANGFTMPISLTASAVAQTPSLPITTENQQDSALEEPTVRDEGPDTAIAEKDAGNT